MFSSRQQRSEALQLGSRNLEGVAGDAFGTSQPSGRGDDEQRQEGHQQRRRPEASGAAQRHQGTGKGEGPFA